METRRPIYLETSRHLIKVCLFTLLISFAALANDKPVKLLNQSSSIQTKSTQTYAETAGKFTLGLPANPQAATSWVKCADENTFCSFTGTRQVRYGANGTYATGTFTNGVACDNRTFGDPVVGVYKACEVDTSSQPPPPATTWVKCADENTFCSFTGTRQVRYGANGVYATRTFTDGVACDNQTFGDPLYGVYKSCDVAATSDNNNYDGVRLLEQASFGPNAAGLEAVRNLGAQGWIEDQFNKSYPAIPYPNFPLKSGDPNIGCPSTDPDPATCRRDHYSLYQQQNWFFKEALYSDAQLRHRTAWALHKLWVTSGVTNNQGRWMEEYFKVLERNAFGNYRDLMYEMTLNPAMGNYLDMARSTKNSPNENYPREIMQLFTIGLYQLNQDGTLVLDSNGNPIPTYDQTRVDNFTKIYTGWTFCNVTSTACPNFVSGTGNYIDPMRLVPGNHNTADSKTLFSYPNAPNVDIPACTNCTTDANRTTYAYSSLNKALDNIFYHPNVAPFVSKSLIQQFVMSAPSPAYVGRVAAVFNNNGAGARGDMKAVIRAILLDPEARGNSKTEANYGKLREPVELVTNILRQFDAKSADRSTQSDGVLNGVTGNLGQSVLSPPSVFSYYPPQYVAPRTSTRGPEFGLFNTGTSFSRINFINTIVFGKINVNAGANIPLGTSISLAEMQNAAQSDATGDALINALNSKMMHGTMSDGMRNSLRTAIQAVPAANPLLRAQQAVYLVATSSQYQVQR